MPRGKPIWFTEYGFPTVNCATNQPNVFIDPKSIESFAPYYSNRAVDRVVQRAAIEATEEFWAEPGNNPTSPIYNGPMVDRRFVWCWDARPYAPVPQGPSGDLSGEIVFTNTGNGLRPFAPVHLNAVRDPSSGDVQLSWIRRTRVGGDSWLNEVPLGEETEEYDVLILDGAAVVRTIRVTSQGVLYTAAQQTADFGTPPGSLAWRVAQVSRGYGRGVAAEALSTL